MKKPRNNSLKVCVMAVALSVLLRTFLCVTAIAFASTAYAQTALGQTDGTDQTVGLFFQACLKFNGNPANVREFLRQHHVPELTPEARKLFLSDHHGVGFDASNKISRLAIVSEDNGVCSVFSETVDVNNVVPLLQRIAERSGLFISGKEKIERGGLTTDNFTIKIKDHDYKLVVSTGLRPNAPFHAAITLSP